ncbi:MAG: hypothetical protein A2Y38_21465 [Spirochaetes bacterium GWB1_59_5]|nr:MAG: hypothetical protein A2Y38_21465 [Spirochaetes bacterium GWB1_59_5]
MLRRFIIMVMTTSWVLLLVLPATPQSVNNSATRKLSIRVGYYDAKPSCWRDESGLPRGIFIDTLNLLAKKEGWHITYSFAGWNQLLDGLETGSLDLIPAIVRTPERETFAVFTEEAVMTDWGEVYAREGGNIRSIIDLEAKRIGALENDFWFSGTGSLRDLCTAFGIAPEYVYFPDYSTLFMALDDGAIDAAAASNSLGLIWQPISRIVPTPVLYNPIELRFAASRKTHGGVALAASIDEAIRTQRADDPESLRDILERYAVPVHKEYVTPAWVSIALAALVAVLSAALASLARQAHALRSSARVLEDAKKRLEKSLEEKDLLVHELSHRVKNNLQIILSLVGLVEGEDDTLGEGALAGLREKVYSISLIEEELHARGAIDEASLRSFFAAMTDRLALTCMGTIPRFSLETDFHRAILVPSAAIPLALILSELAVNAIRYGGGIDGSVDATIRVTVREDGSGEIVVSDCGAGFPPGFDVARTPGLGYRLITALVSQLKGKLSTRTDGGAEVRITIPRAGWTVRLS